MTATAGMTQHVIGQCHRQDWKSNTNAKLEQKHQRFHSDSSSLDKNMCMQQSSPSAQHHKPFLRNLGLSTSECDFNDFSAYPQPCGPVQTLRTARSRNSSAQHVQQDGASAHMILSESVLDQQAILKKPPRVRTCFASSKLKAR